MANPNILNITSVLLSSNSVTLPTETTTGGSWSSSNSRLLLTNPANSNRVLKITSLVGTHPATQGVPIGITVFVGAAGANGSPGSVTKYIFGGVNTTFGFNSDQAPLNSGYPTGNTTYSTYGGLPTKTPSMYQAPSIFGSSSYAIRDARGCANISNIITPKNPYYLLENESLFGVTQPTLINSSAYGGTGLLVYSWEQIS